MKTFKVEYTLNFNEQEAADKFEKIYKEFYVNEDDTPQDCFENDADRIIKDLIANEVGFLDEANYSELFFSDCAWALVEELKTRGYDIEYYD